jgi:Zn ribbon nucleic-acid-binding protein
MELRITQEIGIVAEALQHWRSNKLPVRETQVEGTHHRVDNEDEQRKDSRQDEEQANHCPALC